METIKAGKLSNFGIEVVESFQQELQSVISGGTYEGIHYFPGQYHKIVVETGKNEYWIGYVQWNGFVESDNLLKFETDEPLIQKYLKEVIGVMVFKETYENVGVFYSATTGRPLFFIEDEGKVYRVERLKGKLKVDSSQDIDGEWKRYGLRTYGTLKNVVCYEDFCYPYSYTKLSYRKKSA